MVRKLGLIFGTLALTLTASAQGQDQGRFERRLEQVRREKTPPVLEGQHDASVPLGKRALIDYGGYLAFSYFALEDNVQNTHVLREYDLIGYAHVNIDNVHDFFVRARTSYLDFAEGDSFDGEGDEQESELEQAYYRFDLCDRADRLSEPRASFQLGRQFVYWANGLVQSGTIDGAELAWRHGAIEARAVAGVTLLSTIDFDTSRPEFDEETRRGLYGGIASAGFGKHRPFAYVLVQEDYNDDETLTSGGVETRFDYDSHYVGVGSAGGFGDRIAYSIELVYEGGRALSNSFEAGPLGPAQVEQRREEISALAGDVRLDYLFQDDRNTRLSGEVIFATGDDDRLHASNTFGGNRIGTTDKAFNSLGLINTGLAFSPAVSNLFALRGGAALQPFGGDGTLGRLQVGADVFAYWKFDTDAPIDETTEAERWLGWEPDVYVNWQVTEELSLAARYGVFFPGTAFGDEDDARHALFVGATYAF